MPSWPRESRTVEATEDLVADLLAAGDKLSWSYDDASDTLTVDTSALDAEGVEDTVASLLTGSGAVNVSYDDASDTLTVSVSDSGHVLGGSTGHSNAIAVGSGAAADGSGDIYIGDSAGFTSAGGGDSIAIGRTADAQGNYAVALGYGADAPNTDQGILGVPSGSAGPSSWQVPGDFTVAGSKNFQIDDPARLESHDLRHGAYEGDVAGGLLYRRSVSVSVPDGASTGTATVEMPAWFGPLATNVDVIVQPEGHFGRGYGERVEPTGTTISVTADQPGEYTVVVLADRDDDGVASPDSYEATKPKGVTWDGEPRSYSRPAPGVDPGQFDGVERVEQRFDHDGVSSDVPGPEAFVCWRVTFASGERVEVTLSMDAAGVDVVETARANRSDTDA